MLVESLLTERTGFGLDTASPLQKAICRILDGLPLGELAERDDVAEALGGVDAVASLPGAAPGMVVLCSSVRSAKSMIAACDAIAATQRVDLSGLKVGEIPRVAVVSLSLDLAKVVHGLIVGLVESSPVLRKLLLAEPTADSVLLRHPSGRTIEIKTTAGAKTGNTLVSRWLAGVIFDEAPRMVGSDDGAVVNLDDMLSAVRARMLPGARILAIGSPWAPFGPIYSMVQEHHGKPDSALVVIRGNGPAMNPNRFTPAFCEALEKADPIAYAADVLGQFIDGEHGFLPPKAIERAAREPREWYVTPPGRAIACADLATRGNATTLCIGWREQLGRDAPVKFTVGFAHEWKGTPSEPLKLSELFATWAKILRHYGTDSVHVDQWSFDSACELARQHGIQLIEMTAADRAEMYGELEKLVKEERISLPPDMTVRKDLTSARKSPINTGSGWRVSLPKTGDGRHCDYAPSIALCARLTAHVRHHVVLSEEEAAIERSIARWKKPAFAVPFGCGDFGHIIGPPREPQATWTRWRHQSIASLIQ